MPHSNYQNPHTHTPYIVFIFIIFFVFILVAALVLDWSPGLSNIVAQSGTFTPRSGMIYMLSAPSAYSITIPGPATVSKGTTYTFISAETNMANDITLTCSVASLNGFIVTQGNVNGCVNATSIKFNSSFATWIGDQIKLTSDGTVWIVEAVSQVDGAIS